VIVRIDILDDPGRAWLPAHLRVAALRLWWRGRHVGSLEWSQGCRPLRWARLTGRYRRLILLDRVGRSGMLGSPHAPRPLLRLRPL
jgi:hypothetical protein